MNRSVKAGFLAVFVAATAVYLFGAFGAWDWNPSAWTADNRWLVGGMALFFSVVAYCVAAVEVS